MIGTRGREGWDIIQPFRAAHEDRSKAPEIQSFLCTATTAKRALYSTFHPHHKHLELLFQEHDLIAPGPKKQTTETPVARTLPPFKPSPREGYADMPEKVQGP